VQQDHNGPATGQQAPGVQPFFKMPFHIAHFAMVSLLKPGLQALTFFIQASGLCHFAIQETQFQGQGMKALATVMG
jgi:hypothetical protein